MADPNKVNVSITIRNAEDVMVSKNKFNKGFQLCFLDKPVSIFIDDPNQWDLLCEKVREEMRK